MKFVLLSLPITHSNVCLLLERTLPKLANKLKTFDLHDIIIDRSCVHGIAHLLNTSLNSLTLQDCIISSTDFDSLTTAIATSKLKHLEITTVYSGFNYGINWYKRGQSLVKLLTQSKTLEEVEVWLRYFSGYVTTNDCNVARLLVEAMTNSRAKKLTLEIDSFCNVSDIRYDRDRVVVISSRYRIHLKNSTFKP